MAKSERFLLRHSPLPFDRPESPRAVSFFGASREQQDWLIPGTYWHLTSLHINGVHGGVWEQTGLVCKPRTRSETSPLKEPSKWDSHSFTLAVGQTKPRERNVIFSPEYVLVHNLCERRKGKLGSREDYSLGVSSHLIHVLWLQQEGFRASQCIIQMHLSSLALHAPSDRSVCLLLN